MSPFFWAELLLLLLPRGLAAGGCKAVREEQKLYLVETDYIQLDLSQSLVNPVCVAT